MPGGNMGSEDLQQEIAERLLRGDAVCLLEGLTDPRMGLSGLDRMSVNYLNQHVGDVGQDLDKKEPHLWWQVQAGQNEDEREVTFHLWNTETGVHAGVLVRVPKYLSLPLGVTIRVGEETDAHTIKNVTRIGVDREGLWSFTTIGGGVSKVDSEGKLHEEPAVVEALPIE